VRKRATTSIVVFKRDQKEPAQEGDGKIVQLFDRPVGE
jgi:hypothetical protein